MSGFSPWRFVVFFIISSLCVCAFFKLFFSHDRVDATLIVLPHWTKQRGYENRHGYFRIPTSLYLHIRSCHFLKLFIYPNASPFLSSRLLNAITSLPWIKNFYILTLSLLSAQCVNSQVTNGDAHLSWVTYLKTTINTVACRHFGEQKLLLGLWRRKNALSGSCLFFYLFF